MIIQPLYFRIIFFLLLHFYLNILQNPLWEFIHISIISIFFVSTHNIYFTLELEEPFIIAHRYEHQDIALHCGTMLRECARYEALTRIILNSDDFYNFFKYVEVSTFDIASDAFSTFKVSYNVIILKLY